MKRLSAVTCLVAFAFVLVGHPCAAHQQKDGGSQQAAAQSRPIPIGVKVEAEGGGEGQGMWAQAARDLTPGELKALESLVMAEIIISGRASRRMVSLSLSYWKEKKQPVVVARFFRIFACSVS